MHAVHRIYVVPICIKSKYVPVYMSCRSLSSQELNSINVLSLLISTDVLSTYVSLIYDTIS